MRHLRNRLFLFLCGLLCLAFHGAWSEEDPGVGETDDLLTMIEDYTDRWMETQRRISETKNGWAEEREILQHNVVLLEREQESLKEKLEGLKLAASLYETTHRNVSEALEEQRAGAVQLAALQVQLEERVEQLVPRLPGPLMESIQPHLRRMAAGRISDEVGMAPRKRWRLEETVFLHEPPNTPWASWPARMDTEAALSLWLGSPSDLCSPPTMTDEGMGRRHIAESGEVRERTVGVITLASSTMCQIVSLRRA